MEGDDRLAFPRLQPVFTWMAFVFVGLAITLLPREVLALGNADPAHEAHGRNLRFRDHSDEVDHLIA